MAQDSAREIRLQVPSVDFVETRLPQYHRAFDYPHAQFDPVHNKFVDDSRTNAAMQLQPYDPVLSHGPVQTTPRPLPPKVSAMQFWNTMFPRAMKRLMQLDAPAKDDDSEFSIRALATWDDVHDALIRAKDVYEFRDQKGSAGSTFGKFRRGGRKALDKTVHPLQQGLKLAPNHDIASPVVGAIGVLLEAYRTAAKIRDDVNSGFDHLSGAFENIEFNITRFPDDENITTASEDLVLAIFKAVEHVIFFYTSPQIRRAISAVGKGEEYQKTLVDCLQEINDCKGSLEDEGRKSEWHAQTHWQQQGEERHLVMMHAIGHMYSLLDQRIFPVILEQQQTILAYSRATTPRPAHQHTPEDLWRHLQIPNLDEADMDEVLRRGRAFLPEERGRAEDIVNTSHFRQWVLDHDAQKLLVHGDFDASQPVSPLSVLWASLVKALRSRRDCICLVFFCGRHLTGDEFPGPLAMIRSLTAQVLHQYPECPADLSEQVPLGLVGAGDVRETCRLFSCLAGQVPPHVTIFCLIDGIQFYERPEYLADMEEVVCSLAEIAEDGKRGARAPVKAILSSPRGTSRVRRLFEDRPESLLTMAALPRSEQMTSPLQLERQLGHVLPEGTSSDG